MKGIFKKSYNVLFWVLLFLGITISLSFFKASDLKPSISLNEMKTFEGANYDSKNQITVVYFWATWCGVCSANLPLIKFYSQLLEDSSRFSFISVEEGDNLKELNQYIIENDLKFKVIPANVYFLKEWKVNSYPSFVILDRSGRIRFADSGMMNPFSFFLRIWIVYLF
ncbi:Thioredoxin-like domain protein [Leptospira interrogans serovar Manilae]|uniref:Thioredoxin-like domain protein n=1 Tax=Leptospira interrogans serovar Manilae TaxID=214675 RepID=A0AAQ1P162_LEPIR|nr:thioredoxin-like domain-containing protein [Leptospira interrogans]AKP27350.1 thiol-disulfide isomerase [Leptospira interrogans serovar Manilae]AKP31120.1 thiol-disulfide isomerase [Leptospira interrogans serovar Manilae]EMJ58905.1 thioredoxin-like domain protein [Leptospira interrogans serovar Valbuzzi str. Duyster]ENO73247.1 thioredoxin-like domain protein [Leptospira interrogans serovar Valbuzzi str. Valbuzzi]EYU62796.1 thiol-disulfide isomerase [Leptospira interrogans serovar Manilae]